MKPDKPWQTIAVEDIGLWTMAALTNPKKFIGVSLIIAGEEMTGKEMASLFNEVISRKKVSTRYVMVPRICMNLLEHDIGTMASWIESAAYGANLDELKALATEAGISITPLAKWLKDKFSTKRITQIQALTSIAC